MKRRSIVGLVILVVSFLFFSFETSTSKEVEFIYPGRPETKLTMENAKFGKFTKEWRGQDYYYMGESKDSMICSVLYFKLNDQEQKMMTKPFGDSIKAGLPFIFFTTNSKTKKYESNVAGWGEVTDEFMFRQFDIILTPSMKQKNMFAYCRFGDDLFVAIHLSKANCSAADSIAMSKMLTSLKKN